MQPTDATKNRDAKSRRSFMWLLAGAGLAVALLVVDVVLTLRNTSRLNEDAAWVARTHENMASLESVLSLAKDAESGALGFAITGNSRFLEPHTRATAAIDKEVVVLERLTAHNPDMQVYIPEMRKRIANRLRILDEVVALRKGQGVEASLQAIASGRGKQEMDALRVVVAEMMEHEQGLLRERSRTSSRTYRTALFTGFLSGLSALAAVSALSLLLWWHLAERTRGAAVLAEQAERLRTTLASIGDAVITTDTAGLITNLNAVAESLTGWKNDEAKGQPLNSVFHIVSEETRQPVANPATRALAEGRVVGLANHTILIAKDGAERPIDDSAAPIRCAEGEIVGCVLVFRDVTERRRQERVLRDSEARKTAMFETALDCIISIDHEGNIVEFNAAAERTFGHRREDVLGKELASVIIPPAYREPHRKGLVRYLATGEGPVLNQRLELSALRADGAEFPVELTVTRIPVDGPPIFTAYLRDITEVKRAEEALRDSERRFRVLFDLGPVAIFSCNREGVIQNYNRRAAELWGREPKCGDMNERYCGSLKLYHPDGRLLPHTQSPILEVLRTGVTVKDAEVFIERPDGSRISVIVTFSPLATEQGEITGAITAFYDITKRKQSERELQERAALAAFQAEMGIVLTHSDTLHHMLTRCAETIVQYLDGAFARVWTFNQKENMLELQASAGVYTHLDGPHSRVPVGQFKIGKIAQERQPTLSNSVVGDDRVHDQEWAQREGMVAFAGYPLLVGPKLIGVVALFARHELSEAALQALGLVASSIALAIDQKAQATELRQFAAELSEADRRKNEFLAMLAHELRNPLAPIRNAVQIVKLAKGDEETVQSATETIERQVGQMIRLVDDLLDVSRITRGKIDLRRERVGLASIIEQAIETSRPMIDAAGHELTVTLPPQPVYLHADAVRLAQVFSNLLNNSSKYSEPNGRIWLTVERQGSDVLVSVKDTGLGIPAAMLPKIFDMFTQVDRSLERSQGGLGIGLSLVRSLVQMHGGSVEVFSDGQGHGSTFNVRLPVMASGGRQPPYIHTQRKQYQGADAPRSPPRRILVVDDNRDSAQSLAMLLKITGSETRVAHDGLDALESAEAFRPEAVLLDIGLPKLNGYEVARKIRKQPWGESMVLVALTGWGQDEDRQKSKDAGFNGHMVKPVDHTALTSLLAELLPKKVSLA